MATKAKVKKVAKKKATKKASAKKSARTPKEGGIIAQIIQLAKSGLANKEIIAKGYNKSTVGQQVAKWRKENGKK